MSFNQTTNMNFIMQQTININVNINSDIKTQNDTNNITDESSLVGYYMKTFKDEYKAISDLALYDKKIKKHIDTHYPEDDIFNLIKTVEYYKELDNVENGIIKNTPFSLYAQKRSLLFKKMADATFNYSCKQGKDKAYKMIELITKYVNETDEELHFLL